MAINIKAKVCNIPTLYSENGINEQVLEEIEDAIKSKTEDGYDLVGVVPSGQVLLLLFKKET